MNQPRQLAGRQFFILFLKYDADKSACIFRNVDYSSVAGDHHHVQPTQGHVCIKYSLQAK
jgi:hypothetical protein